MTNTLTQRLNLIKPTPGTQDPVEVAELNTNADLIDEWLVPACKLRSIANQTYTTGVTANVLFDTIAFDTWNGQAEGAMADHLNERIIIRIAGLYLVTAAVVFAANATGSRVLNLLLNGGTQKRDAELGHAGANNVLACSTLIPLDPGDFINATASQASGGNLDILATGGSGDPDGVLLSAVWLGKKP